LKQSQTIVPHKAPTLQPPSSHENIADVIKTFLPNTRCKITNEMRTFLIKLLGNKPVTSTLLYSGHLHGWKYKDFHSRCDSKGRTVSLFQIKDGDCIGGYTSQHWDSDKDCKYKADSSAFLFNLTRSRHFPSKGTGTDITCYRDCGPNFNGGDSSELCARDQPFNGNKKCWSWTYEPGYKIPLVDWNNQLTNQKDGKFTISELEVWLLVDE
jgi:hypothetical protein